MTDIRDDAYAAIKNNHHAFRGEHDIDPHPWTVIDWLHKAGWLAPPVTEELVERVAVAMFYRHQETIAPSLRISWAFCSVEGQEWYMAQARAAIAANREVPNG